MGLTLFSLNGADFIFIYMTCADGRMGGGA